MRCPRTRRKKATRNTLILQQELATHDVRLENHVQAGFGDGSDVPLSEVINTATEIVKAAGEAMAAIADAAFNTSVQKYREKINAGAMTMMPNWWVGTKTWEDLVLAAKANVMGDDMKTLGEDAKLLRAAASKAIDVRAKFALKSDLPVSESQWKTLYVSFMTANSMRVLFEKFEKFDQDKDSHGLREAVQKELKCVRSMTRHELSKEETEFLPPVLIERCLRTLWGQ